MLKPYALFAMIALPYCAWATPAPVETPTATTNTATTPTTPPLRQGQAANTTNNPASVPAAIQALQQKHKQELTEQQKRLEILEQANQTALAQNQELQLKNDNLTVQVQVLQSERSAQMFIYGAVTFAAGTFIGLIIYSVLYTRRRKW